MKTSHMLTLLVATATMATADLVPFKLESGLQPVVPPAGVPASTGSGSEIETGMWFDTTTRTLTMIFGYGSAAGFTDMTGAATAIHIHGPSPDTSALPPIDLNAVLFDLGAVHFPNLDPLKGGIIRGAVVYSESQTNDLFQGLNYVTVGSAAFASGELWGALKPVLNQPPSLECPSDVVQECAGPIGNAVTLAIRVSDPEGDAVRVVWKVGGKAVRTNEVPAGAEGAVTELSLERRFVLGEHAVQVEARDEKGTTECSWKVLIQDTTPPVFRRIATDPKVLWPANHKMVKVVVRPEIMDCSPVQWKIVSVSSNEPVNQKGDGDTSPDWIITGEKGLSLRAERSGGGTGRVYTITLEAADAAGLKAQGNVEVTVPKSMGRR